MDKFTKYELQTMIKLAKKEITQIDTNYNYSLNNFYYYYIYNIYNYFYNYLDRKEKLLNQIDQMELEILYKDDNEKYIKSNKLQIRDPLKYSRIKLLSM
jgi:hypothetical protein